MYVCMYIYVCMYVCIYIYIYICMVRWVGGGGGWCIGIAGLVTASSTSYGNI